MKDEAEENATSFYHYWSVRPCVLVKEIRDETTACVQTTWYARSLNISSLTASRNYAWTPRTTGKGTVRGLVKGADMRRRLACCLISHRIGNTKYKSEKKRKFHGFRDKKTTLIGFRQQNINVRRSENSSCLKYLIDIPGGTRATRCYAALTTPCTRVVLRFVANE